jgi:hypothetical protein
MGRGAAAMLVLLALGACSTFGGRGEAPEDPNLFPKDHRTKVADYLRTYLNNPTGVRDAYISEPMLKPVGQRTQYVACVRFNPRDEKNQYMGNQDAVAIFLAGRLNQFLMDQRDLCDNVAYQRFPEAEVLKP